uniref:Uncharacterized protein n=1 Tax=Romanomermis culicivorax TaxID=13658 RepID=A0A915KM45_ROMCU
KKIPILELEEEKGKFDRWKNVNSLCRHTNLRVNPDLFYLFKKKKVKRLAIDGEVMYFECVSCNSHGNPIGRATVCEDRVPSNPDHGHNPLCVPLTRSVVEAKRIKREMLKTAENI